MTKTVKLTKIMFAHKLHDPYTINFSSSPEQLLSTLEDLKELQTECRISIDQTKLFWKKIGYLESDSLDSDPGAKTKPSWFTKMASKISMQVMNADHSVAEFVKYTSILKQKLEFFDEMASMIQNNLVIAHAKASDSERLEQQTKYDDEESKQEIWSEQDNLAT